MKVDVLVRFGSLFRSWWPSAWGFIIKGERALAVYESPYNPHARGEKRREKGLGWEVDLYENQTLEVWTLEELLEFLQTLDEEDVEVEISEEVYPYLSISLPPNVKFSTSSYTIYL
jgi:hypothetical protein